MELYVLTQSGTKVIPLLKKAGRDVEANILEYLGMAEGATVEQVADALHLDLKMAYDKIRSFSANRWIWRKSTKLVPF
jgi:DNA-binding MarR family transcriptional regulator